MSDSEMLTNDEGKLRVDLCPFPLLFGVIQVLFKGTIKYLPWNWGRPAAWSRNFNCACRHLIKFWWFREDLDPDMATHHIDNAITRLLFLRLHIVKYPGRDDRPPAGFFPQELLDEFFPPEKIEDIDGRRRMYIRPNDDFSRILADSGPGSVDLDNDVFVIGAPVTKGFKLYGFQLVNDKWHVEAACNDWPTVEPGHEIPVNHVLEVGLLQD